MYTKTDAKQVEKFWENDQRPEFYLFWGPKWPKNWVSGAHIIHTSKSTCNEHVEQYWSETSENLWESDQTPEFLLVLGPKIVQKLGIWCPYCTHLWK